jgi:superfamily II DNA or RNA helicase
MVVNKLNESYSVIDSDIESLKNIFEFLKVEIPGWQFDPLIKSGFKSRYQFFASIQHKKVLVLNGHIELLESFGVQPLEKTSEFSEEEIDLFLEEIVPELPFEPYDFQIKAFKESVLNGKQINKMCTGSGKSLTIALLAEFLRRKNKKGILLVPNINLLTQFKEDIKDYKLMDLYNDLHVIGGGQNVRHFNNSLTISTWQSMQDRSKVNLDELDYVITDESHRFASEETSAIVKETINCKYKWGFTGTIPESPVQKMQLFGLFGLPKTYITSKELIDRGLATPIVINSIFLDYSKMDKKIFKEAGDHQKKLKFIKEHEKRNELIVNLSCKLKGNSLVLFQHTIHGKELFVDLMKKLHPDVEVLNKNITGKKSFEFQDQYGIYFLNGEDNAKTRELTRKILEERDNAILIANYAILSTGVNIKRLHNLVMASPLKSYTTITQSIGRLMRLHKDKLVANIYDLVDNFGIRKQGGPYYKQYEHRKAMSYNPEEFPIKEAYFKLY